MLRILSIVIALMVHGCGCTGVFAQSFIEQQAQTSDNRLRNPGFENGLGSSTGWTIASECSLSTVSYQGQRSILCTNVTSAKTLWEQTVTVSNHIPFINQIWVAKSWIAASVSDNVQVCFLFNGSEVNCKNVKSTSLDIDAEGYKQYLSAHFLSGLSSSFTAGIRVKTIGSTSTSVRGDANFVGPHTRTAPMGDVHISAYASSDQSIPTSTVTTVVMNQIVEQIGPISINTTTGVVTIQEDGLYLITGQVTYSSGASGARHFYIRDLTNGINLVNHAVPGTAAIRPNGSKVVHLQSGQQVAIGTFQNSGAALSTSGVGRAETFITVTKIGHYQDTSNAADSLASGSYTPTTANPVNISTVNSTRASYIRIGKKVLVYGELINVATAASNTATSIELSVPIPPASGSFITNNQAYGSGAGYAGVNGTVAVRVRAANGTSRVMLNWNATYTTQSVITYSFMYDTD